MPGMSLRFVRASLIYFLLGVTLGAVMLARKGLYLGFDQWIPIHTEILFFGWVLQMVMGVGYWIFSRLGERKQGSRSLVEISFLLLNAGIVVSIAADLAAPNAMMIFVGKAAELVAAFLFVVHAWPRIHEFVFGPSKRV